MGGPSSSAPVALPPYDVAIREEDGCESSIHASAVAGDPEPPVHEPPYRRDPIQRTLGTRTSADRLTEASPRYRDLLGRDRQGQPWAGRSGTIRSERILSQHEAER